MKKSPYVHKHASLKQEPINRLLSEAIICIKSYNDHNFVEIYQTVSKFGSLGKIGKPNFLFHFNLWSSPGKKRCHKVDIKYSIFVILS